jgi:plasmid stability protein
MALPAARLLRPGAAAEILRVDRATLRSYAEAGRITRTRTLGGHGRYREDEIRALASALADEAVPAGVAVCPHCGHACLPQAERPAVMTGLSPKAAA